MSKDDIIINIPTQTQMEIFSNVHKEKDCNASLENAQTPSTTKYSELSLFRSPMGLPQVAGISRWPHFRVPSRYPRLYLRRCDVHLLQHARSF